MFNRFWPVSILLALTLVACGGDPEQGEQQEMPPSPVTVESVETTDVNYYGEYAARVRGAREVEVSAQVSGILKERRFEEGSAVEEGQTLFLIDPELYEIQLATARADMSDAESAARRAQSEWQRVSGLYEQNALSTRDYENAQSERDAAQARVARARAAVQDAERNLRYTRVESPINGIAGIEQLTEGNLVQSGMALTHVTQVDPIHVHFSMPEADAWRQRVARQNDSDEANQVWAIMPDGSEYAEVGSINYIDPRVSERSASVTMRGRFDNADGELIPGQYIRVRVLVAEYRNVVLIDPSAVGEGRESAQVFVLNDDGETVSAVAVELGPIIDGKQVVVSGLSGGEALVVNGQVALRDGAKVNVSDNGDNEQARQSEEG